MEYNNVNKAPPVKRFKQLIDHAVYGDKQFCYCQPEIFKKTSANPNSSYNARNLRISQTINSFKGGRVQFGNTYLGTFNGFGLNYLGRLEGMPGGSGTPIKNKF
jgi:hypothetical protein